VLRGEAFTDWDLRARRRDTGQVWIFSFSGEPVRDATGQQVLAVVVTRDVTERERLTRARAQAEARELAMREINRRLDEFFITAPTISAIPSASSGQRSNRLTPL